MVLSLIGGLLACVVAVAVLRPLLRARGAGELPPGLLPAAAALGLAIVLLGPTVVLEARETARFQRLGLHEAGIPRQQEPPFDEAFVAEARAATAADETWAITTPAGRCADDREYQWLAFRLHPSVPDCAAPDVDLYYEVEPPDDARVVVRTERYAIAR